MRTSLAGGELRSMRRREIDPSVRSPGSIGDGMKRHMPTTRIAPIIGSKDSSQVVQEERS
jgi:hypothetical protein